MRSDAHILIAEPIYQALPPRIYGNRIQFWKTVFRLSVDPAYYKTGSLIMGPRRNIRSARAEAIKMAREKKATHILFLDDDIIVPQNILGLLLDVDKDIVGGLIHKDDGTPIVFTEEQGGLYFEDHPKDIPFQCGGVGAGCMLIKMSVFDRIDNNRPMLLWYFNYGESGQSMDLRFCRMAISSGCEVWCLPDPKCEQLNHY